MQLRIIRITHISLLLTHIDEAVQRLLKLNKTVHLTVGAYLGDEICMSVCVGCGCLCVGGCPYVGACICVNLRAFVCECARAYVCVWVTHPHVRACLHTCERVRVRVCVCVRVRVCVCEWARSRDRKSVCACVCVRVRV